MNDFEWFQNWFAAECDGFWEYEERVKPCNLSNPGWTLTINLRASPLEGKVMTPIDVGNDEDWLQVTSDGNNFRAAGNEFNLIRMFAEFRRFVSSAEGT